MAYKDNSLRDIAPSYRQIWINMMINEFVYLEMNIGLALN